VVGVHWPDAAVTTRPHLTISSLHVEPNAAPLMWTCRRLRWRTGYFLHLRARRGSRKSPCEGARRSARACPPAQTTRSSWQDMIPGTRPRSGRQRARSPLRAVSADAERRQLAPRIGPMPSDRAERALVWRRQRRSGRGRRRGRDVQDVDGGLDLEQTRRPMRKVTSQDEAYCSRRVWMESATSSCAVDRQPGVTVETFGAATRWQTGGRISRM